MSNDREAAIQDEAGGRWPSPSKKLATEMEKKLKNVAGDTRLVKESQCALELRYAYQCCFLKTFLKR